MGNAQNQFELKYKFVRSRHMLRVILEPLFYETILHEKKNEYLEFLQKLANKITDFEIKVEYFQPLIRDINIIFNDYEGRRYDVFQLDELRDKDEREYGKNIYVSLFHLDIGDVGDLLFIIDLKDKPKQLIFDYTVPPSEESLKELESTLTVRTELFNEFVRKIQTIIEDIMKETEETNKELGKIAEEFLVDREARIRDFRYTTELVFRIETEQSKIWRPNIYVLLQNLLKKEEDSMLSLMKKTAESPNGDLYIDGDVLLIDSYRLDIDTSVLVCIKGEEKDLCYDVFGYIENPANESNKLFWIRINLAPIPLDEYTKLKQRYGEAFPINCITEQNKMIKSIVENDELTKKLIIAILRRYFKVISPRFVI